MLYEVITGAKPNATVDIKQLLEQYNKNPEIWKKAFSFLAEATIETVDGRYELQGNEVFALVSHAEAKPKENTRYETHNKYIDIQYVVAGEEIMGITTIDQLTETESYIPERDITFFNGEAGNYQTATPTEYFVFFPWDRNNFV